jgi:arsenate reductase (thioredoxin)
MMTSDVLKILVLCTGNSCRSVMAEALINGLARGQYRAWSAGSHPAEYVHSKSIETLTRHGIDPGQPRSKSWHEFAEESFDLVITVCDQAAGASCPRFPGTPKRLHWSMPDPAKVAGSEAVMDAAFDETFFLLRDHVEELIHSSEAATTGRDGVTRVDLYVDRSSGTVSRSTL